MSTAAPAPTLEDVKCKFFENVQKAVYDALTRSMSAELQVQTEVGSWLIPMLGAWLDKDWSVIGVFDHGACAIHVHRRTPLQT